MNHKLFDLFFVLFLNHAIVHLFLDSEIGYGLARYDDHKGFFLVQKDIRGLDCLCLLLFLVYPWCEAAKQRLSTAFQ